MPTYLVAFIVSDLAEIRSTDGSFSVWARKNAISDVQYIMEEGQKLLKQMADLVNVPYLLPKVDMVAVPDFRGEGMENWGLITYK